MIDRKGLLMALVAASLVLPQSLPARAQSKSQQYEIGVVYYADQGGFKPLTKEVAVESGRPNFCARIKGAWAAIRLHADQPQLFLVCGVDPTRFKLYRFKSEPNLNERSVLIMKINMWIGGGKTVLQDSEIPAAIKQAEGGCFTLTPQKILDAGEYGFSPIESLDSFTFGVGDVKQSR